MAGSSVRRYNHRPPAAAYAVRYNGAFKTVAAGGAYGARKQVTAGAVAANVREKNDERQVVAGTRCGVKRVHETGEEVRPVVQVKRQTRTVNVRGVSVGRPGRECVSGSKPVLGCEPR